MADIKAYKHSELLTWYSKHSNYCSNHTSSPTFMENKVYC